MPPTQAPKPAANSTEQYCVVCGAGSHRADWANKSGQYVACDDHTTEEVQKAIAEVTAKNQAPVIAPTKVPANAPIPSTSSPVGSDSQSGVQNTQSSPQSPVNKPALVKPVVSSLPKA